MWAFAALTASPGVRAFYDQLRSAGDTHHRALRASTNGLVGILHGCHHYDVIYDETLRGRTGSNWLLDLYGPWDV